MLFRSERTVASAGSTAPSASRPRGLDSPSDPSTGHSTRELPESMPSDAMGWADGTANTATSEERGTLFEYDSKLIQPGAKIKDVRDGTSLTVGMDGVSGNEWDPADATITTAPPKKVFPRKMKSRISHSVP